MKIKGSLAKPGAKKVFCLASVLAVLFLGVRLFQNLTQIDAETGFFSKNHGLNVALLVVCSALLVICLPVLLYLTPLPRPERITVRKAPLHSVTNVLLAVGVLLSMSGARAEIGEALATNGVGFSLKTAWTYAKIPGLNYVFAVLAIAVLLLDAVAFATGKDLIAKTKALQILPAVWGLGTVLRLFTITVSYKNNTTLMLAIFGSVFLTLFLFEYARKIAGVGGDLNSPSFYATGILAAVCLTSVGLATIPGLFNAGSAVKHVENEAYRILGAFFCLTAMLEVWSNPAPDYEPAAEKETEDDAQETEDTPAPTEEN